MSNLRAAGLYYVHTDQLDTPRYITNSSKQLVWEWLSDPFGTSAPNQNPSGLGTFVYNLRMPGQVYDSETGHDYNYFRDYDPTVGRYIEPDPLGVIGLKNSAEQLDKLCKLATWGDVTDQTPLFILPDLNLYFYAHQNPVNNLDSKGRLSIGALLIAVPIIVGGAVFLDLYA